MKVGSFQPRWEGSTYIRYVKPSLYQTTEQWCGNFFVPKCSIFPLICTWVSIPCDNHDINLTTRYGRFVATYPWWAILGCLVIAGLSGIGLLEYRVENNAFKLWIPDTSDFLKNYNFLQQKFPPDTRFNNMIVSGENVLTPEIIKQVKIHYSCFK